MAPSEPYESAGALNEYLLFHYGREDEILPYPFGPRDALDFAVRTVEEGLEVDALPVNARAFDLGCAVGRSSFELARFCPEVVGLDYSQRFVAAATTLAEKGEMNYRRIICGDISEPAVARVPDGVERSRVRFLQGDAGNLPSKFAAFDVVHASNLLCRMPEPARFLDRLSQLVKTNGQLILATPCTWLESFTPKDHWIGGTTRHGDTLDVLKKRLDSNFALTKAVNLPFLIREHARKFQWSVAQVSSWRRR
jgi:putative 4-mercaptohistidine N1-methyltranferase